MTAFPASAQDVTDGVVPAQSQSSGLEEIIVTARKRVESVQDVPVLVTAISQETVQRYDLTSLEKVAAFSPQFNIGRASNGSGAQITLRGIGSQATSIGLEQSTAVIVDGVYYGQARVINEAFFDLDRVELLKGPQALFFGKNATAGVVSVTTANPTDTFEAMGQVGYEFRSENLVGSAYVSGPIAPNLSARLAVRVSNMFGGYFKNKQVDPLTTATFDIATGNLNPRVQLPSQGDQPGTNEKLIRGTLQWEPTSRLTANLKASWLKSDDESNSWNMVPFRCALGAPQPNPNIPCEKKFNVYMVNAPEGLGGATRESRDDGQPFNAYRSWAVTGSLNYDADNYLITSVTNYNWNRNRWALGQNVPAEATFIAATENTSFWAFSNETRVQTSFDGPVNAMVGGYYQKTRRNFRQQGAFAPLEDSSQPLERRFDSTQRYSRTDGETISAFGQLSWKVVPTVEIAGGVRYTHETKDSILYQEYVNAALQGLFIQYDPNDPSTYILGDQTFNNWSPEATITWQPSDEVTVYGAYKTAYKSGGFSNSALVTALTTPADIAFNPEKAKGFEGGIKTTLLDRQLRLNVAAYTYKYTNLQIDYFNSITFQFITTNAGSATTKGVEVETEFAPRAIPGFSARAVLAYNKARYKDYLAPCYGGQSTTAGCTETFQGGPGQDLSGVPTALAPEWTGSLGFNYESDVSDSLVFMTSANMRYSSSYLGSSFGHPLSRQSSYAVLDGTIGLKTADDRLEFSVIGKNLTNRFYISGVQEQPNSGSGTGTPNGIPSDIVGLVALPRTIMAQVTARFR
ncbi:TonB-dependent receptor domain-containing protein [Croceicoccus sp. BE223]|uniref:TonB-dependent receptor n=1 Tax=Croceicoccus sp. BE223 TaxID=2817716 RepID=UPI00286AE03C|nr:TonB-dependent receptor [Croceicoccus sp. BE223]